MRSDNTKGVAVKKAQMHEVSQKVELMDNDLRGVSARTARMESKLAAMGKVLCRVDEAILKLAGENGNGNGDGEKEAKDYERFILPKPIGARQRVKKCSRCKKVKPATAEHFGNHATSKDGLQPWCRNCQAEHRRELSASRKRKNIERKIKLLRKELAGMNSE